MWLADFARSLPEPFRTAGFHLDDFSPIRGDKPATRFKDRDVRETVDRIWMVGADGPSIVVGVLLSLRDLVARVVALSAPRLSGGRRHSVPGGDLTRRDTG